MMSRIKLLAVAAMLSLSKPFDFHAMAQVYIPVPVYDYYAAFAYSRTKNKAGVAWNYSNERSAEKEALRLCMKTGAKDCVVLVWFANQCGTIASTSDGIYGLGFSTHRRISEREALKECNKAGGRGCTIKHTACTAR